MKVEHQFKIELFVTVLFGTLGVLAVKYVGFSGIRESIFTSLIILETPVAYFISKQLRIYFYDLLRGRANYED